MILRQTGPAGQALLCSLIVAVVSPAAAQESGIRERYVVSADTGSWSDGLTDGRRAAAMPHVYTRAVGGFVGGIATGFSGLLTPFFPPAAAGFAGGIAIMATAAVAGSVSPPRALIEAAVGRGSAYASGFAEGYAQRIRSRRRMAALLGGAVGTAAGAWVFFKLVPHTTN